MACYSDNHVYIADHGDGNSSAYIPCAVTCEGDALEFVTVPLEERNETEWLYFHSTLQNNHGNLWQRFIRAIKIMRGKEDRADLIISKRSARVLAVWLLETGK